MNHRAPLRQPVTLVGPATGELSTGARTITPAHTLGKRLPDFGEKCSLTRTRRILPQESRWTWANAQLLVADVPVDGSVAREWLPPVLTLPDFSAADREYARYSRRAADVDRQPGLAVEGLSVPHLVMPAESAKTRPPRHGVAQR